MIAVLVVHRQLAQAYTRKLAGAPPTDPRVELERPFAICRFALAAVPPRFGDDAVETGLLGGGGFGHDLGSLIKENGYFTKGRP